MDSTEVTTDTTTGTGRPKTGDRDTTMGLRVMAEDQGMTTGIDTIVSTIITFTTLGNRITTGDMRWAEGATAAMTIGGATWEELAIIREMIIAIRWITASWHKGETLAGNRNENGTTDSIISDVDTTIGTTFVINTTATTTTANAILSVMSPEERIEISLASTPIMFVGTVITRADRVNNSIGKGN